MGSGEEATISCVVSGLTAPLDSVQWQNSGEVDVATLADYSQHYEFVAGDLVGDTQTTTLKVLAAASTTADTTYTCVIASVEWAETAHKTIVSLLVFSK